MKKLVAVVMLYGVMLCGSLLVIPSPTYADHDAEEGYYTEECYYEEGQGSFEEEEKNAPQPQ